LPSKQRGTHARSRNSACPASRGTHLHTVLASSPHTVNVLDHFYTSASALQEQVEGRTAALRMRRGQQNPQSLRSPVGSRGSLNSYIVYHQHSSWGNPLEGAGWVQPPGGGLFFCPPVWGPVLGPTQWPCTMAHSVPLRRIPTGIAPRWVSIDKHLRSIFLLHWSTTPVLAAQRVPGSASFLLGERCASQLGEGFRARSEQPKSRSRRNYSKTPQE
jgi:hypothetical protein